MHAQTMQYWSAVLLAAVAWQHNIIGNNIHVFSLLLSLFLAVLQHILISTHTSLHRLSPLRTFTDAQTHPHSPLCHHI